MQNEHKTKLLDFYQKEKRMPTYSEMMKLFNFKSKNAVYRIVEKLVDAGIVAKDSLGRLVPNASFTDTPLLGLVKAGFPAPSEQMFETTINLDDYLIKKKGSTYILEVDGDSMIEAHIADGDMVIAEQTNTAKDGDIVIAEVDGEFTMKYLRQIGSKIWLEPANKNFKPIYPENDLQIRAIVKGVIRKY
jgi:SOS regulatory protein LexA